MTALEAGREGATQKWATAQAQLEKAVAEATELRLKLVTDQTALLATQARCEALAGEVTLANERMAAAKRALSEETALHAATQTRLEEAREALRNGERRRQRGTIAGAVGGAAIGVALMLRRRLGG